VNFTPLSSLHVGSAICEFAASYCLFLQPLFTQKVVPPPPCSLSYLTNAAEIRTSSASSNKALAVKGGQETNTKRKRRFTVNQTKKIALTAGLALAASMMATATCTTPIAERASTLAREQQPKDDKGKHGKGGEGTGHKVVTTVAREQEPGDDKGKDRRKDDKGKDGKGHKVVTRVAREQEPGDDKGKDRRKDDRGKDGKGHKVVSVIAREQQPRDDKGKDDKGKHGKGGEGAGHKVVTTIAREQEPGDDKGKDRRKDDKGKDGKGHKYVETIA
jgi:hypothetical protein